MDDKPAEAELPLEGVGLRLRRAREAAGLSRADIAARTRIAERHLASIEEGRLGALASRTYAVGFTRAYARAVGLDEAEIKRAVDEELGTAATGGERPAKASFEPGDPARVPSARTAWFAALGAAVVVVAGFVFWRSHYAPAVPLPSLLSDGANTPAIPARTAPVSAATRQPVVFTAREANVWIRLYDADGNQLLQKILAQGESFTVPAEANGPMIRTARPDALGITVGGKPVAPLSMRPELVTDVPVSASALLSRRAADVPAGADAPPVTMSAAPAMARDRPVRVPVARAETPSPSTAATTASGPAESSTTSD